ncbi:MAG: hypothetical protein IPL95_19775 [Saprospiraceae bacterium]|nr:hypothetical protein [Saprospiraceae bacterium]
MPFNSLASAKAYQGTLHFDTQKFEFVDVVGMDQEQYSLGDIENGNITFLHAANLYKPLDNIQLMLKAKQNCYLAEGLSFSSNPLVSEVYWTDKQWSKLEMQFENKTALLLQNTPNPFSNSTSIPFVLPSQQEVRFDFYDVNGSLIKSMTQDYSAGYHQLTIDENELNATGIIYYQMITKDNIQTKNMLLIKK